MDNLLGTMDATNYAYLTAEEKVVEGMGRQIKLYNFVPQARKRGILKPATSNEASVITALAYEELYNYLIKKNVIKSEV